MLYLQVMLLLRGQSLIFWMLAIVMMTATFLMSSIFRSLQPKEQQLRHEQTSLVEVTTMKMSHRRECPINAENRGMSCALHVSPTVR